jgi:hypothetical protein
MVNCFELCNRFFFPRVDFCAQRLLDIQIDSVGTFYPKTTGNNKKKFDSQRNMIERMKKQIK